MSDKINVVDVTEADAEQFLRETRAQVADVLDSEHPFAMIALQDLEGDAVTLRNVIACGEEHLLPMAVGFLQLVGTAKLGVDAVNNLPPAFHQSMCLAAGLKVLNQYIQDMASRAKPPRTPA